MTEIYYLFTLVVMATGNVCKTYENTNKSPKWMFSFKFSNTFQEAELKCLG